MTTFIVEAKSDDMDKKYQAILDKLEEIATNKAEHDKKLDTTIDQTRQLQDDYAKIKADAEELRSNFDECMIYPRIFNLIWNGK